MDKRAEEKYVSIWWFAILVVVATGIAASTILFFSADFDSRSEEAKVLQYKILDCVTEDSSVNDKIFLEKNFDILSECGLQKSLFQKGSNFVINVSILDKDNQKIFENVTGDSAYLGDCAVLKSGEIKAKNYPVCIFKNYSVFYNVEGKIGTGKIFILTASNQRGVKNE